MDTDTSQPFANIYVMKAEGVLGGAFPLYEDATLGRGKESDIRVRLPSVSRKHAIFTVTGPNKVLLVNMSPTNPTLVNGEELSGPYLMQDGDVVTIISRKFKFEYVDRTLGSGLDSDSDNVDMDATVALPFSARTNFAPAGEEKKKKAAKPASPAAAPAVDGENAPPEAEDVGSRTQPNALPTPLRRAIVQRNGKPKTPKAPAATAEPVAEVDTATVLSREMEKRRARIQPGKAAEKAVAAPAVEAAAVPSVAVAEEDVPAIKAVLPTPVRKAIQSRRRKSVVPTPAPEEEEEEVKEEAAAAAPKALPTPVRKAIQSRRKSSTKKRNRSEEAEVDSDMQAPPAKAQALPTPVRKAIQARRKASTAKRQTPARMESVPEDDTASIPTPAQPDFSPVSSVSAPTPGAPTPAASTQGAPTPGAPTPAAAAAPSGAHLLFFSPEMEGMPQRVEVREKPVAAPAPPTLAVSEAAEAEEFEEFEEGFDADGDLELDGEEEEPVEEPEQASFAPAAPVNTHLFFKSPAVNAPVTAKHTFFKSPLPTPAAVAGAGQEVFSPSGALDFASPAAVESPPPAEASFAEPIAAEESFVEPEAAETSVVEPAAAEESFEEPEAEETSIVEPAAAEKSFVEPEAAETSIVEAEESFVEPTAAEESFAEPEAEESFVEPAAAEESFVEPAAAETSIVEPAAAEKSFVEPEAAETSIVEAEESFVEPTAAEESFAEPEAEESFVEPAAAEESFVEPAAAETSIVEPTAAEESFVEAEESFVEPEAAESFVEPTAAEEEPETADDVLETTIVEVGGEEEVHPDATSTDEESFEEGDVIESGLPDFEPSRLSTVPEETDADFQPTPAKALLAKAASPSPLATCTPVPTAATPAAASPASDASDFVCAACGSEDTTDDNLLVICEKCDDAYHQTCGNVPVIPEGDWFCSKCAPKSAKATRKRDRASAPPTPEPEAAPEADPLAGQDVAKFTVAKLREELKTRGLPTTGLKKALAARLAEFVAAGGAADDAEEAAQDASPPKAKRTRGRPAAAAPEAAPTPRRSRRARA